MFISKLLIPITVFLLTKKTLTKYLASCTLTDIKVDASNGVPFPNMCNDLLPSKTALKDRLKVTKDNANKNTYDYNISFKPTNISFTTSQEITADGEFVIDDNTPDFLVIPWVNNNSVPVICRKFIPEEGMDLAFGQDGDLVSPQEIVVYKGNITCKVMNLLI